MLPPAVVTWPTPPFSVRSYMSHEYFLVCFRSTLPAPTAANHFASLISSVIMAAIIDKIEI